MEASWRFYLAQMQRSSDDPGNLAYTSWVYHVIGKDVVKLYTSPKPARAWC